MPDNNQQSGGMNWSGSLSAVGSIISTGAQIYASINNGKIKAIEAKMQEDYALSQQRIVETETTAKLANLEAQYAQQMSELSKTYSDVTSNQQLAAMMQGRTTDSISSTMETDKQSYLQNKQQSLLNKESAQNALRTERDLAGIGAKSAAIGYQLSGELAERQGKIDAATSLLQGTTQLSKMNAFDKKTYTKDEK